MYGLEKKKNPKEKFAFDLEEEIKNDPKKAKEYIKKAETNMQNIKNLLRSGQEEEDFDQIGILLHGYAALIKVLKKIQKSTSS